MYVDAFTCCVGPVYASYLAKTLPVWTDTLDSLTVVTARGDAETLEACRKYRRVRVVETDVFKAYGADFNKGAALVQAYAAMDPVDVALHFDSDIEPPPNWRKVAEREFAPGSIFGSRRHDEHGNAIRDDGPWPYGYFQMWHAADSAVQYWPIFEVWHPHAGSYDLEFLEKWPKRNWRGFNFRVKHFGEVRRNWFGVGLPEEQQAEAFRKMDRVHKVGLANTRVMSRSKANRLDVPDFAVKLAVPPTTQERARAVVRACMTADPFLASCVRGAPPVGYTKVGPNTHPDAVREMVEAAERKVKSGGIGKGVGGL